MRSTVRSTAGVPIWSTVVVLLAAFVFAISIASTAANAQEDTGSAPSQEPDARESSRPIPASLISAKAEDAANQLRALRLRPVEDPEIDQIREKIPAALERYESFLNLTETKLSHNFSTRTVEDLNNRWNHARIQTRQWQSRLARRSQSIDRDLETLQEMRTLWKITLDTAVADGMQEALVEVPRRILGEIEKEEKRFGAHRAELLSVETTVFRVEDIVSSAFNQIQEAQKVLRIRLYAFDSPPIWESLTHPPPVSAHWGQVTAALTQTRDDWKEFVSDYQDWLILHLVATICFAIFLAVFKRRVRDLDLDDPKIEASAKVLTRPASGSLIVSLFTFLIFYPDAPIVVSEFATILVFLPLYRIIPKSLMVQGRSAYLALFVLHVLCRVTSLLPFEGLLKRVLLLLITATTLLMLLRGIRMRSAQLATAQSAWEKAILRIQRIAVVLLGIGFVANILGNVSLDDVVARAVISSAYSALALYALYLVLESVLRIGLGTRTLRQLRMVRRHEQLVRRRILSVLRILFVVLWLAISLRLLQVLPVLVGALRHVLTAEARFGEIGISLGDILAFAVTVWISFLISRVIRFVLDEDVFPRLTLPRGVDHAVSTGFHYAVLLLGFILALAATGADLGKFTLLAGAFGVGIGFGLQNVVNNFISGLILIAERPIMTGDTIEVGTMLGNVKRIGMRSSTVRTWEGAEVIVPNGNLVSNDVINWTLSDRQRRIEIPVGVAYGSPVKKVMEILTAVASQNEDVLESPAPYALFIGFGDSSLDFALRFWTARFEGYFRVRSAVLVAVEEALNEDGIVIPFPQRDLHVKTVATEAGRTLHGEDENRK